MFYTRNDFSILPHFKFILIKSKNYNIIYMYNNYRYIYVTLQVSNIFFCKNLGGIFAKTVKIDDQIYKHNIFIRTIKYWHIYTFRKLKFRGKGLKIKKRKNTLKFYFWFSHMQYGRIKNNILRKIGKFKYILISTHWNKLSYNVLALRNVRRYDKYTLKGLRLSRQYIYKKPSIKNVTLSK